MKCLHCGKEAPARPGVAPRRFTCSPECSRARLRSRENARARAKYARERAAKPARRCLWCKGDVGARSKYCSAQCLKNATQTRISGRAQLDFIRSVGKCEKCGKKTKRLHEVMLGRLCLLCKDCA